MTGAEGETEMMCRLFCWKERVALAWRERTDLGGVSDDVAMMGLMLGAAVAVGGGVYVLVNSAVGRLDFGF